MEVSKKRLAGDTARANSNEIKDLHRVAWDLEKIMEVRGVTPNFGTDFTTVELSGIASEFATNITDPSTLHHA